MLADTVNRRIARVERSLRETLAQHVISDLKSELKGFVSITNVRVTKDIRNARIYISVIGSDEDASHDLKTLKSNTKDLQFFLGKALQMRYCPKLEFFLDNTLEESLRIHRAIEGLQNQ